MPIGALMVVLAMLAQEAAGGARTWLAADLDGDGRREAMTFFAGRDGARGFVHLDAGSVGYAPPTSPIYPAWKALAGRLAGDAKDSVVLGVWTTKGTRPGEAPKKTIWVIGIERGKWVERWRGSRLARPFDDFDVRDLDGDGVAELVARECGAGRASEGFTAYRWEGFGFAGVARLAEACDARPIPWTRLRLDGGRLWLDD